jgi:hypothetical protein
MTKTIMKEDGDSDFVICILNGRYKRMVAGLRENGESENSGWVGLRDAGISSSFCAKKSEKVLDTGCHLNYM